MMFGGVVLLAGVLLGVIFWRLLVMVTQHGSEMCIRDRYHPEV